MEFIFQYQASHLFHLVRFRFFSVLKRLKIYNLRNSFFREDVMISFDAAGKAKADHHTLQIFEPDVPVRQACQNSVDYFFAHNILISIPKVLGESLLPPC